MGKIMLFFYLLIWHKKERRVYLYLSTALEYLYSLIQLCQDIYNKSPERMQKDIELNGNDCIASDALVSGILYTLLARMTLTEVPMNADQLNSVFEHLQQANDLLDKFGIDSIEKVMKQK